MRAFPFCICICMLLLFAFLPSGTLRADETDRQEHLRQLEEVEERLEQTLRDLQKKKTTELDLLAELDRLDQNLRTKQARVSKINRRLEQLQKEIDVQKKDLARRQKEVEDLQDQVKARLTALYKSEETGTLKTLFSSDSPSRLLEDYDFLGRIVRHDRELLENYRSLLKKRQESIRGLAANKARQQEGLADLQREEQALVKSKQLKERFLAAVRRDRSALDAMAAELRRRAARLTSLVKGLESDKGGEYTEKAALFPLQKGRLPWPVRGRVKIGFGTKRHPELGTMIESHGIEIATEPETPIQAVWDGRVAFAKRFQGYGNLLIIDHDDGYYTLYAQASQLLKKAGDRVRKGEKVAISGFDGTDSVYFEIRRGSTPLDPKGWMAEQ